MSPDDWFWTHVARGDGCWEWGGTRSDRGYGVVWNGTRQVRAHRLAWEMANGPIPEGQYVLHSCDNRGCVRLDHLRLGTQRENIQDMDSRGRRAKAFQNQDQWGSRNNRAKLTEEQVAHIRGMTAAGHYHDAVALQFGVSRPAVSMIASRVTWPSVAPIPYTRAVRNRPVGRSAPRRRGVASRG